MNGSVEYRCEIFTIYQIRILLEIGTSIYGLQVFVAVTNVHDICRMSNVEGCNRNGFVVSTNILNFVVIFPSLFFSFFWFIMLTYFIIRWKMFDFVVDTFTKLLLRWARNYPPSKSTMMLDDDQIKTVRLPMLKCVLNSSSAEWLLFCSFDARILFAVDATWFSIRLC